MKDKKIEIYKKAKYKNSWFNENGFLQTNDCIRYGSLDKLVEKFNVKKETIETLLYPYQDASWTLYIKEGKSLDPHYKCSEVREVLKKHGLVKGYKNRERSSPWEIREKEGNSTKIVKPTDLTMEVDGKFYGRVAYWNNAFGIKKGLITKLLNDYENTDLVKEIIEFAPVKPIISEKERRINKSRIKYLNLDTINKIVQLTELRPLETSEEMPQNADKELYKTSYIWSQNFREKFLGERADLGKIMSYAKYFINNIKNEQSYLNEHKGIKYRVYHEKDAKKAHFQILDKIKGGK